MRVVGTAVAMLILFQGAGIASTFTVNADGSGDLPSISWALLAAQPGDTIRLTPGIYTGPDNTSLNYGGKDVVLMGAGPEQTILDCEDSGDVVLIFRHAETRAAVLRDMTLRNNYSANHLVGVYINRASPTIENVHIEDFRSDRFNVDYTGGALRSVGGSPRLKDVLVRDCEWACGMSFYEGAPELENVTVRDCQSALSGGGLVFYRSGAQVRNLLVADCDSYGDTGSGVHCGSSPSPIFDNCRFERCGRRIVSAGCALDCFSGAAPVLRGCVFLDNHAWAGGGGLRATGGSAPELEDVLFVGCVSSAGGAAIFLDSATATLNGVTITGSQPPSYQGENEASVIHCINSSPVLERVVVAFNPVSVGLWADASSAPQLSCCDFMSNGDANFGGDMIDPTGMNGNISADPLWCGAESDSTYAPASGSPCAPANNSCGVLMGAVPVGCDLAAFAISGRVIDEEGQPLEGVSIEGLGYPVRTDVDGSYSVARLEGWSGSLTPALPGFVFLPEHRDYADLVSDHIGQDFSWERRTLHRVPAHLATLRAAIAAAQDGDTILVAPGTYSGPDNRELDFGGRELLLLSEGGAGVTVIDCEDAAPALSLRSGEGPAARVEGFTVRNGRATYSLGLDDGGGIYIYGSSPTLRDIRFESCTASDGGGLYVDAGTPSLRNLRFESCSAANGGGLMLRNSASQVDSVVCIGCYAATDGGGMLIRGSTPTLRALTLVGNSTPGGGGGLALNGSANVTLERSILAANTASYGGGVYCLYEGNTLDVACTDVYRNVPDAYGNCPDPTGFDGNLALDPLFCDPMAQVFTLRESSPCAGANNDCGVDMGYFPVGCSTPFYTVAGRILTDTADPVPDVTIGGFFFSPKTDSSGVWSTEVPPGWGGTVTASRGGYDIAPSQYVLAEVQQDELGLDFTATRVTLRRVPQESPTIREALPLLADGDTVLVAPGTYGGPGFTDLELLGTDAVVLGEGGSAATTIDCGGTARAFIVREGESAAALIQGFTVRNGRSPVSESGGGVRVYGASPTLRDLVIMDCEADVAGGGIYFGGSQSLLEDVEITSCRSAGGVGGGILAVDAILTLHRVLIAGCRATGSGGGICSAGSQLSLEDVEIRDCHGTGDYAYGGGMSCLDCTLTLLRVLIAGCDSRRHGGGIRANSCALSLVRVTLADNHSDWDGGALFAEEETTVAMDSCLVARNSADRGGGLVTWDWQSPLNLNCSNVANNSPDDYAGEWSDQTGQNGNISEFPRFCNAHHGDYTLIQGSPCLPENNDCGVLMGAFGLGCDGTPADDALPTAFALAQNHPNPFNPKTTLRFDLPEPATVQLSIYDANGRRVARLLDGAALPAGHHAIDWNGRGDAGRRLASGVYFARFEAESFHAQRKLVMLR